MTATHEATSTDLAQLYSENLQLHAEIVRLRAQARTSALTIREAAQALGLDQKTIRRRIADGTLPASRVKGTNAIRIRRADLDRLLQPVREV